MTNEIFYYSLIGLCFLVVLFVIYLASTGKFSKKVNSPQKERSNHTEDNRAKLKKSYERTTNGSNDSFIRQDTAQLLETIRQLKDENNVLRMQTDAQKNQIEILKKQHSELTNINNDLVTQKERLTASQVQLELLQKQKEDLFAIAIHDLKNPAGAIKGYVDLLRSYDYNAVEQQEIMGHLVSTSSRIIEIAQSISVIIAEAESTGGLKLTRSPIKAMIDTVCSRNMVYAQSKGVKIINSSSPDSPAVLLDEFKFEEVIENLVNNAIKFANDGTIVQVRSYFNSTNVLVEISDNGVGMSKEDIARAFNKGAKLTARPTAGETSSGLGLWIVKNIVEGHGGRVSIESKLGAGTKFTIQLPINA